MWCDSYVYIRMTCAVSRNSSTKQIIYGCYQLTYQNVYLQAGVSLGNFSFYSGILEFFIKIFFLPERSGCGPRLPNAIRYSVIIATHVQYMYMWIYKHGDGMGFDQVFCLDTLTIVLAFSSGVLLRDSLLAGTAASVLCSSLASLTVFLAARSATHRRYMLSYIHTYIHTPSYSNCPT